MRQGPARRPADHAEPVLQSQLVDLVDNAVNVVGQLGPVLADVMVKGERLLNPAAEPRMLVDRKPPAAKALERLLMGAGDRAARLAPVIGEEFQWPARGDRRIELAQGAGGDIARVGEDRLAGGRALLVDREKPGAFHIDLAADLEYLGPILAGKRASIALLRRRNSSYAASEISGASLA